MRRVFAAAMVVLAAVAAVAVPVAAHTNDLEVDTQVSADGEVVLERAVVVTEGYLVVHRDDGGDPGEPIGVVPFRTSDGHQFDYGVPIDDAVWADWEGSQRVWVAFHREESGGGFDPADDPIQDSFAGPVAEPIHLAKGDVPVRVLNDRYETYTLEDDRVTIREVATDRPATVVVRVAVENGTGPVAGTTTVPAGVTRNVTVPLDDAVFAAEGREVRLEATLTRDGSAVTVGGSPVRTGFDVERVGPLNVTNTTGTATATAVPATTEPAVVTPSPTPSATPTPAPATPSPTSTDAPGLGVVVGAVALLAAALVRRRSPGSGRR